MPLLNTTWGRIAHPSTLIDHEHNKVIAILSHCVWGFCYIAIDNQNRASPDNKGFCGERNGEGTTEECLHSRGGCQRHSIPPWNSHRTKDCKKGVIRGLSTSHPHSQQCRVIWRGGGLTAGVLEMSSVSTWVVGWMNFFCHFEKAFPLMLKERLDGTPPWGFCHLGSWAGAVPLLSHLKNRMRFLQALQPAAGMLRGWQEKALDGARLNLAFTRRQILCSERMWFLTYKVLWNPGQRWETNILPTRWSKMHNYSFLPSIDMYWIRTGIY